MKDASQQLSFSAPKLPKFWKMKAEMQQKEVNAMTDMIKGKVGQEQLSNAPEYSPRDLAKLEEVSDTSRDTNENGKTDLLSKLIPAVSLAQQLNPWTLTSPYLEALGYDRIAIRCERASKLGCPKKIKEVVFTSVLSLQPSTAEQTIDSYQASNESRKALPNILEGNITDKGTYVKIEGNNNAAFEALAQQLETKQSSQPCTDVSPELPKEKKEEKKKVRRNRISVDNEIQYARSQTSESRQSRRTRKTNIEPEILKKYLVDDSRDDLGKINDVFKKTVPQPEIEPNPNDKITAPKRPSEILLESKETTSDQEPLFSFGRKLPSCFKETNETLKPSKFDEYLAKYNIGDQKEVRKEVTQKTTNPKTQQGEGFKKPRVFNPEVLQKRETRKPSHSKSPDHSWESSSKQIEKVSAQIQTSPIREIKEAPKVIYDRSKPKRPRGRPWGWRKNGENTQLYNLHMQGIKIDRSDPLFPRPVDPNGNEIAISTPLNRSQNASGTPKSKKPKLVKHRDLLSKELLEPILPKNEDHIFEDDDDSKNFILQFGRMQENSQNRQGSQQKPSGSGTPYIYSYKESPQERREREAKEISDRMFENIMNGTDAF